MPPIRILMAASAAAAALFAAGAAAAEDVPVSILFLNQSDVAIEAIHLVDILDGGIVGDNILGSEPLAAGDDRTVGFEAEAAACAGYDLRVTYQDGRTLDIVPDFYDVCYLAEVGVGASDYWLYFG